MSKPISFFPHDTLSRSDQSIQRLIMKQGMGGLGIYWCLIEMLHENYGKIELSELERITYELHENYERITDVLKNYTLFTCDETHFWSERVNRNISEIMARSNKARESINARWNNERNTNVKKIDTNEPKNDTIKVKEIKIKEIKVQTPFDLLWFKWVNYRTAIKKPIKPVSMELAKKELQDLSGGNIELAEKIVNQSIAKSWQGLFELKNSKNVTEEPVGKKLRTL